MAQNKMECVKPRCANKLPAGLIQKAARKSISGILCARAPQSIAFFPRVLPANASPIQAPSAICVRESIKDINRLVFYGCCFILSPYKIMAMFFYKYKYSDCHDGRTRKTRTNSKGENSD